MNAAFLISHISQNQGLTHEQIAHRADADPAQVAGWSRGEDCPPEKHAWLRKMAGPKYHDGVEGDPDTAGD